MTKEQYEQYDKLNKRKFILKNQLASLNSKGNSNDIPIIEQGWLDLSYGNGGWCKNVCDNKDTLKLVKELLIKEQTKELNGVIKQMKEL